MTIFRFESLPRGVATAAVILAAGLVSGCKEQGDSAIEVPSGREVTLIDVITNVPGPSGVTARFRYLAPGLTADDSEAALMDMQVLCDSYALPQSADMRPEPQQIVISLSAEIVPFGQAVPNVVQLFEAFRPEGTQCVWEQF